MRSWVAVPGKLWFILLASIAAMPQSALALTASQVYEQVKDSVVVVKAFDQTGKPVGQGSGVRLPSGDVITNYHVVKAGVRYLVGQGKQGVPATLKAGDPDKDLCLLSAPALTAKPARLGRAAKLKVGEPVYAVGAPQGLELSLSEGIVSQLRGGPPPLIQTTVAISPGSSGGGLFNAQGELVGITTFYLKSGQSLNFAVPVEWIGEVARGKIRERPIGEAPVAPAPGTKPKKGWLNRASALEKAQDWQGLLAHSRRWTQAEPGDAFAWANLGVAYGEMGRHREASEAYREALRLKPDFVAAWYNLGWSYGEMGRHREAVEAYREALRLKPDYANAWYNLGVSYQKMAFTSDAVEALREALRLKPDYADAWFSLGLAYGQMSRYREAIEAFREALRLKPDYAAAWSNLGVAYEEMGLHREAIEANREALRLKPDYAATWNNLGVAYRKMDRHREAIEACREALRLKPDYANAWYNLAAAYARSGNRSAALEAVRELRRYDPKEADKLFNLIMKP